jgi:transposase
VRVGAPWRDVPDCYGSWRAVYALFRRWQRAGAWAQIVTALQTRADAAGLITWDVSVDSTIARALAVRYEAILQIAVINDWLLTSL